VPLISENKMSVSDQKKILAVSSSGGHWEQLMLLRPAFDGADVTYVTTIEGLLEKSGVSSGLVVKDCNRNRPWDIVRCALGLLQIMKDIRPQYVVTTGAAPGIIALAVGRMLGAQTVWIDSVANSEELSMSGKLAGKIANLWLTQWQHVSMPNGPIFRGRVL
jgi:Oligosaccharide biosynthesis protein Alg14 like.